MLRVQFDRRCRHGKPPRIGAGLYDEVQQAVEIAFLAPALVRLVDDHEIEGAQPEAHHLFERAPEYRALEVVAGVEQRRLAAPAVQLGAGGQCIQQGLVRIPKDPLRRGGDAVVVHLPASPVATRKAAASRAACAGQGQRGRQQCPLPVGLGIALDRPVAKGMRDQQRRGLSPGLLRAGPLLPRIQVCVQASNDQGRVLDVRLALQLFAPLIAQHRRNDDGDASSGVDYATRDGRGNARLAQSDFVRDEHAVARQALGDGDEAGTLPRVEFDGVAGGNLLQIPPDGLPARK
ncbi:hypothetical protein [Variovorax sp. UC122_21]|uniref:hypothetical protein n=1 Tax=Variovorax sp. UC122_21 TaxID=3374554 RepID=UPI003756D65B